MSNDKFILFSLPTNIRYSKNLSLNEKLFYNELVSISTEQGYCLVEKDYFSIHWNVHKRIISNWVHSLESEGFISYENYKWCEKHYDSYKLLFRVF